MKRRMGKGRQNQERLWEHVCGCLLLFVSRTLWEEDRVSAIAVQKRTDGFGVLLVLADCVLLTELC